MTDDSSQPQNARQVFATFRRTHVMLTGFIWFLALNVPIGLGISLIVMAESTPTTQLSDSQGLDLIYVSIPLLIFLLFATIWWGCTSWRTWNWRGMLVSAAAGTCVITGGYVFLWMIAFAASPNEPNQDIAAGAGVAILMLPVFGMLLVLLAVGSVTACTWDRFRRDHRPDLAKHDGTV